MKVLLKLAAILIAVSTLGVTPASASRLGEPKEEPILEIAGLIGVTNRGGSAVFDRAMLEAVGLETITTKTPWHNGPVRFEGVPLAKLMAIVGAQGKSVRAVALNDYASTIPIEDFAQHGVILALKRDGQYMPVRDKGPLFVIYPYDAKPELKSQMYFSRSVWQVKRLEIQP